MFKRKGGGGPPSMPGSGLVEKAKRRAKPPTGLTWKTTWIVLAVMAFSAGGFSIDREAGTLDTTRFALLMAPMVVGLYLFAKANKQGRLLGAASALMSLAMSGAPSAVNAKQTNGEQAYVAFGAFSDFTQGLLAGPLKGWLAFAATKIGAGLSLLAELVGKVLPF